MKAALVVLAITMAMATVCPRARAQAVAESAVLHAGSTLSANVARSLGGQIQKSLSSSQSQFSYPPRTAARARTRASKARSHLASRPPIAISSVVGGPARCAAGPKPATPNAKAKAGPAPSNCLAKAPVPVASAKSNPSEITVSF